MQIKKQQLELDMKQWFQIGKGVLQGYILSPCLFNLYAEYIMQNAGLDEAQAGIKIDGRNVNNLRYASLVTQLAMNPPAMQETLVQFQEDPQRRDRLPTPVFLGFPGGTDGKNWPAMWETWVQSLGWEDPLEEGMATHSSILAWRIPMNQGSWWATVHVVTQSQTWLSG